MAKKKPVRRFRLKRDLVLSGEVFTHIGGVTSTTADACELVVGIGPNCAGTLRFDLAEVLALPEWFEEIPASEAAAPQRPAGKVYDDVVAMLLDLLADARLGRIKALAVVGIGPRHKTTEAYTGVRRAAYAILGALDVLKTEIKVREIFNFQVDGPEEKGPEITIALEADRG